MDMDNLSTVTSTWEKSIIHTIGSKEILKFPNSLCIELWRLRPFDISLILLTPIVSFKDGKHRYKISKRLLISLGGA